MIQLDVYGPPLMEYQGKGSLIFDEATQMEVEFKCIQLHNGNIYVHVKFLETVGFNIILNRNRIEAIHGYLEDGRFFKSIGHALAPEWSITNEGSVRVEGLLLLSQIEIKIIKTETIQIATKSRFYLTNLRFLGPISLEIKGLNITIFPTKYYKKLEDEMCTTKACTVTSYLEIPHSALSKETVLDVVANLCSLLSFAKGAEIIWPYYQEMDETGTVILSVHRLSITSNFGSWEIISHNNPTDLKIFIETIYEKYIDLSKEYELNKIIHTIVISKLDGSFLELRALNVTSAIDFLRGRWAKIHGRVKILPSNKFNKCKKSLNSLINDFIKIGITKDQINQILNKIPELNRPSLRETLTEMAVEIRSDISTDQIELFTTTRNKLVHESCFATHNHYQEFVNIISLIDNLIMTLLGYQGPYVDCRSWKRVTRLQTVKDVNQEIAERYNKLHRSNGETADDHRTSY
jgi:hypothetical protein